MTEEIEDTNLEDLAEADTLQEVKKNIPKVFAKKSDKNPQPEFEFTLNKIQSFRTVRNVKTAEGVADMHILDSNPKIYSYRNALIQLETYLLNSGHISKLGEELKKPIKLFYKGREGESRTTKYLFEDR